MHISYTAHNPNSNISSTSIVEYLDKENNLNINNDGFMMDGFFNSDYSEDNTSQSILTNEIINQLDNNRGTMNKKQANFFMLNVAPSSKELNHIEKLAIDELSKRGIILNSKNEIFYNQQKEELIKIQLKLFAKDIMVEYAKNFNREIYVNEDGLPTDVDNKKINLTVDKIYNEFLKNKGLDIEDTLQKKILVTIDNSNTVEFENGKVFEIYNENIKDNLKIYLSEDNYSELNDSSVFINEKIYNDKLQEAINNYKVYNSMFEINKKEIKEIHIDKSEFYEQKSFIVVNEKIKNIEKPVQLFLKKEDCVLVNGTYQINELKYSDSLINAKVNEYKKLYVEEFEKIKSLNTIKYDRPLDKKIDNIPELKIEAEKKILKKITTQSNVDFKNFLVEKKLLPKPNDKGNINLKNTIEIKDFIINQESEKAKLVKFKDPLTERELETWIPKFMIKDNLENNEIVSFELPKDFIENKIKDLEVIENSKSINLHNPIEKNIFKTVSKIDKDCIEQTININGLDNPVILLFDKERLNISDNKIEISKGEYQKILNKEIFENAKIQYSIDYLKFQDKFKNELIKQKISLNEYDKKVDNSFKTFLIDKDILKSENEIIKLQKEQYSLKTNSKGISEITIKDAQNDNKEIKIFIPKSEHRLINDTLIIDSKSANDKILKAEENYQYNNSLSKITYDNTKIETVLSKDKEKKEISTEYVVYETKLSGLKDPLKIKFKTDEITFKDGVPHIENYKLNYQIDRETKKLINAEYGEKRNEIYKEIAESKGFDLSKRSLEEKDLLWFAKVEEQRKYKHTDKYVESNKVIFDKIKKLEIENPIFKNQKISTLKESLIKDKITGEIIKEGNIKGGNQHHVHILVSRHDKTMKNPRNKLSISPLANAKNGYMPNGKSVGFDRTEYAGIVEKVFDKKFDYNRDKENTFAHYNSQFKLLENNVKGELKSFISKHTGINTVKNELNPIINIKEQLGISRIPTNIPKSPLDIAVQGIKKILTQSEGIGY